MNHNLLAESVKSLLGSIPKIVRWLIGFVITVVFCVPLFLIFLNDIENGTDYYIQWQAVIWGVSYEEAYKAYHADDGFAL